MGIESYSPTVATNATASGGSVNMAEVGSYLPLGRQADGILLNPAKLVNEPYEFLTCQIFRGRH